MPFSSLASRTRKSRPGSTPSRHHQRPPSFCCGGLSRSVAGVSAAGDRARTLDHTERLAELTAGFARTGQGNQADADRAQTELPAQECRGAGGRADQGRLGPLGGTAASGARPHTGAAGADDCADRSGSPELSAAQLVAEGSCSGPSWPRAATWWRKPSAAWIVNGMRRCCRACSWMRAKAATAADRIRRLPIFAGDSISTPPSTGNSATSAWGKPRPRRPPAPIGAIRQLQIQLMDRVAREIVEAHAQSESLCGQIAVARSGIRLAKSYRRNKERIRGGQGLPIEMLQALQALDQSRREYLRAVRDYNEWQFRLYPCARLPHPASSELCEIGQSAPRRQSATFGAWPSTAKQRRWRTASTLSMNSSPGKRGICPPIELFQSYHDNEDHFSWSPRRPIQVHQSFDETAWP